MRKMVTDFIFSAKGISLMKNFESKFGCAFRIDEPSGDTFLIDVGNDSYKLKPDISVEDFETTIIGSLMSGKNLLLEKHLDSKVEYEESMVY